MKKILLLFAILIIFTSTYIFPSEHINTIAILDFNLQGIPDSDGRVLTDYIVTHIVGMHKYNVVDRIQRETILSEIKFSLTGVSDEEYQLELGELLSVNLIVVGSIGKVGNQYILNIKLVDVKTGATINAFSKKTSSLDYLIAQSKYLTYLLLWPEEADKYKNIDFTDDEIYASMKRMGSSIEASTVGLIDSIGISAFGLNASYAYQFNNILSLGAWVGGAVNKNRVITPLGGLKIIIGNKVDDFALSINLGFFPSVGIYYRNFFLDIFPLVFIGGEGIYFDLGYSFYFGE